jgi:hypothetical protein
MRFHVVPETASICRRRKHAFLVRVVDGEEYRELLINPSAALSQDRGTDKQKREDDRRKISVDIAKERVLAKSIDQIFRPSFRFPRRRNKKADARTF